MSESRSRALRKEIRALLRDKEEAKHVPVIERLITKPADLKRAIVVVARKMKLRGETP